MQHYIKLFKSFFFAFRGIVTTIASERNMRIHITCVIYMFSILLSTDWFVLSRGDWCALLLTSAMVLSGELFNTAAEHTVNLVASEYNELAKKAKDAASGAVLAEAFFAVLVGLVVLFQPEAFRAMFAYFRENPPMLALFALSIVPATLFIFFGIPIKTDSKRKNKNIFCFLLTNAL